MRILVSLILMLLTAFPAWAQPYEDLLPDGAVVSVPPSYHRVTGVAANDVLNIRSAPDASSGIIGSYAPGAAPVEVIATFGNWAYVVADEQSGWVSRSYLAGIDVALLPGTPVPLKTGCYGTEPFWGLEITDDGNLKFSSPDDEEMVLPVVSSNAFAARPNRFFAVAEDGTRRITAFLSSGQLCSDGMSDREHGWSVQMLKEDGTNQAAFEGCCRRAPDPQ